MRIEDHIFAGLGDKAFSAGTERLDKLQDAMDPKWDCQHHWHWEYPEVIKGIIQRWKENKKDKPVIILGGHSMGVNSCTQVADELDDLGLPVALLYAIDPTAGRRMVVGKNVKKTLEFWSEPGWFGRLFNAPYNARRSDPTGKRGGKLMYVTGWKGTAVPPVKIPGGHVASASDPKMIKDVIDAVALEIK